MGAAIGTPSNEKRATESARPIFGLPRTARSRSRQNASMPSSPVSGSMTPSVSSDFSTRLRPALERPQAHERKHALDQHGIAFDANQIGQPLVVDRSVVEHPDRQVAKPRVLGEHGESASTTRAPRPSPMTTPSMSRALRIARGGLDAERTDEPDALTDRDRERGIGARHVRRTARLRRRASRRGSTAGIPSRRRCARRNTVACSVRTRSAERSRATSGRWNRPSRLPARRGWQGAVVAPPAR